MKNEMILVVDDKEINRAILCNIFEKDYQLLEAQDGVQALKLVEQYEDRIVMILLDIVMPIKDGFAVLEELNHKKILQKIPVILITGDESKESERKAYEYKVSDIILKPFDSHIVQRRIYNMIELYSYKNRLEHMVKEQTSTLMKQAAKLKEANNQVIDTLSTIVEFRNLESGLHIMRIKGFTRILAKQVAHFCPEYELTDEKIEIISQVATMHDVGKIVIPDSILLKPTKLTEDEFEIMKSHTTKGCEIISMITGLEDQSYYDYGYEICRHHHERYDGKGYPDNLLGDEIPISAQIVSVADVYDALVSDRVYKAAYSKERAYQMIIG
ncbi:MAG: response regulator [Clostridiales bacterium]|nr:response regulator [Clostridiales bacterium]